MRPQKGNSGVSYNDTLLNFRLRLTIRKSGQVVNYREKRLYIDYRRLKRDSILNESSLSC